MPIIIRPQFYRRHLSYGLWLGERFVCYAPCFCRAQALAEFLRPQLSARSARRQRGRH